MTRSKKNLLPILGHKKFNFVLWSKGKVFAKFQKTLVFQVPVIFWKWKLCRACATRANSPIFFWNLTLYPIGSIVPVSKNCKKVIFHSTPVYFSVISQSATSVQSFPLTDYQSLSGIIPTDGTTGIYLNYARKTIGTGRRGSLHLSEIYRMHKWKKLALLVNN